MALRVAYYANSMTKTRVVRRYDELVDILTANDVQEAATMWLTYRYVRVTLFPEQTE